MSDYQLLLALMDEYKAELKRRKEGETFKYWDCGVERERKLRPANKSRLSRLRIEISSLMLRMEKSMAQSWSMDGKECWV